MAYNMVGQGRTRTSDPLANATPLGYSMVVLYQLHTWSYGELIRYGQLAIG